MGEDLDRYRRDVCGAEKHTHGPEGEIDCVLRSIVRLRRFGDGLNQATGAGSDARESSSSS